MLLPKDDEVPDMTSDAKLDALDRIKLDLVSAICGANIEEEIDEFGEYASGTPSALPKGFSPLRCWC